jgi:tetratricopeptide (TPR) repeat protein
VVLLEIVGYPKDKDLVFISPWDKWTHVPAFDNEAKNFVAVTLAERGDRACLENTTCIRAAAAQINRENAPKTATARRTSEDQSKEALATIARQFGLDPKEIDQAIRAWGERSEDPHDQGLAALYEKRYSEASMDLEKSFSLRKRAEEDAREKTADAASFLGQSLYEQGRYREAALAYTEAANRRPEDAALLNNLALSWHLAGDYATAEPLFRRALAIDEKTLGPDHPTTKTIHENLQKVSEAEKAYTSKPQ